MIHTFDEFTLVHGSPYNPEEFNYIFSAYDADKAFRHMTRRLCFIGHTHVPHVFIEGVDGGAYLSEGTYVLNREKRYIVNVGSVGQPREVDKRLACAVFDDEKYQIECIRLLYVNQKAAEKN